MIEYTDDRMPKMLHMTIEYYGEDNDISKREFIEHEYFGNPIGKTVIKLVYDEKNQVLAGQYIVIPMHMKIGDIGRITEVAGMSCGMLVDFMAAEGMKDAAMSLLKCMEQYFFSTKVGLM